MTTSELEADLVLALEHLYELRAEAQRHAGSAYLEIAKLLTENRIKNLIHELEARSGN